VLSVAQIGNALRVLAREAGDASTRLREALSQAGLQAEVAAIEPSLEDVFVAATHGDDDVGAGNREQAA
jgi:ABC-2 type transport system ATP-binding protein